jgi:hypothetical protein
VAGVKKNRPDLTDEQMDRLFENLQRNHDPDEGVCLETLIFWADKMFPKKQHTFKVEITEVLQMQVDIPADSPDEALEIVREKYHNCAYILTASYFVGVDFSALDEDSPEKEGESGG